MNIILWYVFVMSILQVLSRASFLSAMSNNYPRVVKVTATEDVLSLISGLFLTIVTYALIFGHS